LSKFELYTVIKETCLRAYVFKYFPTTIIWTYGEPFIKFSSFLTQQMMRSSPYHCHCGHRAEVTKCDLVNGCYHDHSTAVTDPHLSTVYTRSGYNYNHRITATELNQARTYTRSNCNHSTAVTDAKPDTRQSCHHQPQLQTSDSTPSPLDNTVTEDMWVC